MRSRHAGLRCRGLIGPGGRWRRGKQRLYRYYVSQRAIKDGADDDSTITRVPAAEIEQAVIDQLRSVLRSPEIGVATWRVARKQIKNLTESEVRDALDQLDPLWDELFPAEQARIVQLLVERVQVDAAGIDVTLRTSGLASLATELLAENRQEAA